MRYKLFAFLLSLSLQLAASQYNSTIIELEAKLFPKMMLLSEDIDKNSSVIEIFIIAKESAEYSAKLFQKNIEKNYAKRIRNKNFKVTIKAFEDINSHPDAIITLYHSDNEIQKIAQWANKNKIPSFCYDPTDLENGILASLYIGATTKPYLNKITINRYSFSFDPYLLKLSKFYN